MDITRREITKIAREVSKFTVRTLRREGVGPSEFDVIHVVRKNPGITQAGVCKILGLDKGAVARETANLEAKGYLRRQANPQDARSQLLFATEQAERLKNSKAQVEARFYEWLLGELTEAERQQFARLLEQVYLKCKAESKADFVHMQTIMQGDKSDEPVKK